LVKKENGMKVKKSPLFCLNKLTKYNSGQVSETPKFQYWLKIRT